MMWWWYWVIIVVASLCCVGAAVVLGGRKEEKEFSVGESTIRRMTRLAIEHGAVNLSQGFPNEAPPEALATYGAGALLAGESEATAVEAARKLPKRGDPRDALNQYSFPFGAGCLRRAVSGYYERVWGQRWEPETEITVVLGATEGFAATIRALTKPKDVVAFFEPFHELYPSQVALFYCEARAVTLEPRADGWRFDPRKLDAALRGARLLLYNSPHNPTGHAFDENERAIVARLCAKHGVTVVTDDIYEHVVFRRPHVPLSTIVPRQSLVVVDSISKTCKATGWRVGWVLADEKNTAKIRAVHDQLVACGPTPLQVGVAKYLEEVTAAALNEIADDYAPKRDCLVAALRRVGFDTGPPVDGAYYVFASYDNVKPIKNMSPLDAAMYLTARIKGACAKGRERVRDFLGRGRTTTEMALTSVHLKSHNKSTQVAAVGRHACCVGVTGAGPGL
ncbi:hypothetical protein CTAYLR_005201 [Chrysophaeum taylorii]|uniref:Aminotransferase class I/classII large domain-containing protein n=1 Tax=Chrysophaeum taylorii TaxID=2483200 RepID=A0AAD7XKE8_9STRA|nr:hypothetical protein CTAYLR_005184 [Chrysophaeum taylorii]KAJ8614166.1 hypothetical protein CTAYLR_005201 [Chrysophaeum taylorii]